MRDLIDVLDGPLTVASHLASAALPSAGLLSKWSARLTGKLSALPVKRLQRPKRRTCACHAGLGPGSQYSSEIVAKEPQEHRVSRDKLNAVI